MTTANPFKYYAARGHYGYMHIECWPEFEKQNSRYDTQGQCKSRPQLVGKYWDLGQHTLKRPCIHCNQPLSEKPK